MKYLLLLYIILISGCSSLPRLKEEVPPVVDKNRYSATCLIDGTRFVEEDVELLSTNGEAYKVKAKDGKILGLNQSDCFIVRNENATADETNLINEKTPKAIVSCKLGSINFTSSPFYLVGDEKNHYKAIRIKDNGVFLFPRLNCSILFSK